MNTLSQEPSVADRGEVAQRKFSRRETIFSLIGLFLVLLLMVAVALSSVLSGQMISKWGKYKSIAIAGMVLAVLGSTSMLRLDMHSGYLDVIVPMALLGLGLGASVTLYGTLVQAALPQHLGQASASFDFFQELAGPVALAVLGSVLTQGYVAPFHAALSVEARQSVPAQYISLFDRPNTLLDPSSAQTLSHNFAALGPNGQTLLMQVMQAARVGLATSIHGVFIVGTLALLIGLFMSFFLPEISLEGVQDQEQL